MQKLAAALQFLPLATRAARFSVRRPWLVASFFLALISLGAVSASFLELRLNYMELLPDDAPEVVELKWVMKKAGTEGYLVTALSGGSREQRLAIAPRLEKVLEALPEIRYAEFRNDVAFFRKNAGAIIPLRDLRKIREDLDARVKQGVEDSFDLGLDDAPKPKPASDAEIEHAFDDFEREVPPEILENPEKTELYLLAKPAMASLGVNEVREMLAHIDTAVRAEIEKAGVPIRADYGGPSVFMKKFNDGLQKDLGVISLVALLASASFLLLATRRPLAAFLILVPIAGAITMALGMATLTIGHLNIISSLLVAILLGLGVEFGIHLVLRASEARAPGSTSRESLEKALLVAVPETMDGAFSGAVTNAASFLVLVFASFGAYRQFGVIAATGVLLAWLASYTLLPALIVLVERLWPGSIIRAHQGAVPRWQPPRALLYAAVVGVPLLAMGGAWSLPRVGLERSFNALNGTQVPDPVGQRAAIAMGSTLTPAILWVHSVDDARRLEAIFARLKAEDTNPHGSIIDKTISLAGVLQTDWAERRPELDAILKSLHKLPDDVWEKHEKKLTDLETAAQAKELSVADLPQTFTRKFAPLDGDGTFVLFIPSRSVDDADELDDFVTKLELAVGEARKQGIETKVMSENRIAVHIFRQVFADTPFIAWSATLVALGVLFLLLRSVRETLIVFAPLALGMLMMVLGMNVFHVKLNFINMCVIPSIFTVAIDNTVHLYHRYVREGQRSMPLILGNTGMAVLTASAVNASGYSPTLLADFYGLKSLGLVASFGMIGMVLATVVWFPSLLMLVPEKWVRPKSPDEEPPLPERASA